jgi:hypothetical protein
VLALSITPTQDGTTVVTGETKLDKWRCERERGKGRNEFDAGVYRRGNLQTYKDRIK